MARCLLGLGSNLGDRRELLRNACREIAKLPGVRLLARSQWHETAPIGGPSGQSPFLNGALLIQTTLQPQVLGEKLRELETQLGRSRRVRWSARTVDLDVLLIDETTVDSPDLIVPHPRMSFRRFVLEPAVEIAPWMRHSTSGWTLAQLLWHLNSAAKHVAVVAADERVSCWLVQQMAKKTFPAAISPHWMPSDTTARPALIIAVAPIHTERLLEAIDLAESNRTPKSLSQNPLGGNQRSGKPERSGGFGTCSKFDNMTETSFRQLLAEAEHGPMARITTDDPATLLAEAEAAILAIGPNIAANQAFPNA